VAHVGGGRGSEQGAHKCEMNSGEGDGKPLLDSNSCLENPLLVLQESEQTRRTTNIAIYMLHYNPRHVSSSAMLIFRRTNCIITTSGIVTLCKQPVESGALGDFNWRTVRLFTESDDTRCCNNTICPPEDEQGTARNMLRIIM